MLDEIKQHHRGWLRVSFLYKFQSNWNNKRFILKSHNKLNGSLFVKKLVSGNKNYVQHNVYDKFMGLNTTILSS